MVAVGVLNILPVLLSLTLLNGTQCADPLLRPSLLGLKGQPLREDDLRFHAELSDTYDLYWDFTEEDITFEVHVETAGWVGFGISPNGGMTSADLVIGWIDYEGDAQFHDRHGVGTQLPPVDEQQDWFLDEARKADGKLVLRFHRRLDLCNEEDLPIEDGTMRVIWTYNDELPDEGQEPSYHGHTRGTRSLQLILYEGPEEDLPDDVYTVDLTVTNVSLPIIDTYYYCQLLRFPEVTEKKHVIRFEPIYTAGNELILHHILVYHCREGGQDPPEAGHECWHPNMPDKMLYCDAFMFAWSIGEDGINFPSHTGFMFDPDNSPRLIMIEIHYDNPQLIQANIDSSGLRLFLTSELREYDTGVMTTGTLFYPLWDAMNTAIPPHAKAFRLYNHCTPDCLKKAMDEEGLTEVKVYGVMLHAHLAGVKFHIRHFRNGTELQPWVMENNYDFNFQHYIFFKEEITLLPTDKIETICEWDTRDRENVTWGGFTSMHEMCQAYILYYPRFFMSNCWTEPTAEHQLQVVNATTEPISRWPYYKVTGPEQYVGMTLHQIFATLDWTDPCLREELEELINGQQVESWAICTTEEESWNPQRRLDDVLSDTNAQELVCGWQDGSKEEKCYEDDTTTEAATTEAATTEGVGGSGNGSGHTALSLLNIVTLTTLALTYTKAIA